MDNYAILNEDDLKYYDPPSEWEEDMRQFAQVLVRGGATNIKMSWYQAEFICNRKKFYLCGDPGWSVSVEETK